MRRMLAVVVLCFLVSVPPAHAELIDFGGGLLYDAVQDLTWLDPFYAQPPHTLMFGDPAVGGCTQEACDWYYTWRGATAWVAGLSYEGYNDWRLPDKLMPGVLAATTSSTACSSRSAVGSSASARSVTSRNW